MIEENRIFNGLTSPSGSTESADMNSSGPGHSKLFKCKQCSFVCVNKEDYWSHQRKMHIKPEKLLECTQCSFVTEYKHHLEYHLRNHLGSKPFKCSQCDYACVNLSMLRSHQKSHSKSLQYNCSDCSYSTKYYHSLKTHMDKCNHSTSSTLKTIETNVKKGKNGSSSASTCSSSSTSSCGKKKLNKAKENSSFNSSSTSSSSISSLSSSPSSLSSTPSTPLGLQNPFGAALAQYQQQQSLIPSFLLNSNFLLNPVAQYYLSPSQANDQSVQLQMALAAAAAASSNYLQSPQQQSNDLLMAAACVQQKSSNADEKVKIKDELKCSSCSSVKFENKRELKKHLKSCAAREGLERKNDLYECVKCELLFRNHEMFMTHKNLHDLQEKEAQSLINASSNASTNSQQLGLKEDESIKCNFCGQTVSSSVEYFAHLQTSHQFNLAYDKLAQLLQMNSSCL